MGVFIGRKGIRRRTLFNITSKDDNGLAQSLLNKRYVHSLPTQLLLQAHNRIEEFHAFLPRDKLLQKVHTHLFLEMELRNIDHFDSVDFFEPSPLRWPYSDPLDPDHLDNLFSNFVRRNPIVKKRKR